MSCDNECRIQAGFNCAAHADKEWNAAIEAAAKVVFIHSESHTLTDLVLELKRA